MLKWMAPQPHTQAASTGLNGYKEEEDEEEENMKVKEVLGRSRGS